MTRVGPGFPTIEDCVDRSVIVNGRSYLGAVPGLRILKSGYAFIPAIQADAAEYGGAGLGMHGLLNSGCFAGIGTHKWTLYNSHADIEPIFTRILPTGNGSGGR